MERKPVNRKNLAIETSYGYLNIHLEFLFKAIKDKNTDEIAIQKKALSNLRNKLIKLGYFGGQNNDGERKKIGRSKKESY